MTRHYTPIDRLIIGFDEALRVATGNADVAKRENPATEVPEVVMDEENRQHAAGLMRINHAGEVCAQALYAGQAATARNPDVQAEMQKAASEEIDHLSWCKDRLDELESHPSRLDPLWYAGSFAIGAVAGLTGDGWSLGFLKETENQVEAHLAGHIQKLPPEDARSRAILDQMKIDEAKHARMAEDSGAFDLPRPVRRLMKVTAGAMKAIAYRV
ncbi:MAG: 2-polyprenyl-3-methyl-6-methoxy-1,4-benzoquinone monooxygenase [Gammaproteobacteria bacterium]|nr:2-polyprenyl-3-methyl-6-methoxy-1,4-benzoquinone monooxygenase [Gammaproteobacteria bacterium]MBT8076822.1 2-polyprenyl-3-methyl-6-methoxy-1,4-benzoquinone monooxygenase [Gammaproteobacteria bacterium]NNK98469.1 2-polyprenyl-3-methyl-6-methoxy-1,4-benzoquinone monooxygenase [Xanthomonadales bacterium]